MKTSETTNNATTVETTAAATATEETGSSIHDTRRGFSELQLAQIQAVSNALQVNGHPPIATRAQLRTIASKVVANHPKWCPAVIVKNKAFKVVGTHLYFVALTTDKKGQPIVPPVADRNAALAKYHELHPANQKSEPSTKKASTKKGETVAAATKNAKPATKSAKKAKAAPAAIEAAASQPIDVDVPNTNIVEGPTTNLVEATS